MFYDNRKYFEFVEQAKAAGINIAANTVSIIFLVIYETIEATAIVTEYIILSEASAFKTSLKISTVIEVKGMILKKVINLLLKVFPLRKNKGRTFGIIVTAAATSVATI